MTDTSVRDDTFVRLVKELADTNSPRLIENASIVHALTIIECLLDAAKKHKEKVRIVSGCLMESFYSSLVDKAREVMQAEVPISVVVLKGSKENLRNNPFCNAIDEDQNGEVHFVADANRTLHFVVTGDSRYRVEVDDEKKKAIASFNDPTIGRGLVSIYEDLLKSAPAAG